MRPGCITVILYGDKWKYIDVRNIINVYVHSLFLAPGPFGDKVREKGLVNFYIFQQPIALSNASVNSKHQLPPPPPPPTPPPSRATPGVLHSTAAPGQGFILDGLPRGSGFFISIKLHLVQ